MKRVLRGVLLSLVGFSQLASPLRGSDPAPRTLLISLDAIPFWVLAEVTAPALGQEALFQDFKGPVPVISTFPSSTSVAMVGLLGPLGLGKSPGYEAKFFDWQRLQARGGGPISYHKISFPWREFFDWSRRGPMGSAVEAIRPVKSGIKRLRHAIDEFASSEMDVSLIYIAATDTAVHVVGPESVKELFRELDAMLRDARARRPDRPFETIIFSDHGVAGGDPLENVTPAVKQALKKASFRPRKKLKGPRDVVLTPFGLVSNFEAYSHDEDKTEVAAILVSIEGVDLCAYRETDGWQVVGPQGSAHVEQRVSEAGVHWRYRLTGTDPLGYAAVMEELSSGSPELAGWVKDEELFAATREEHFPDALYRIAGAFELVSNPASVVCSLGAEYMYGSRQTDLLAKLGKGRLRWTHGSLNRAATVGFLISDAEGWDPPPACRYDTCLVPFQTILSRHRHVLEPTEAVR